LPGGRRIRRRGGCGCSDADRHRASIVAKGYSVSGAKSEQSFAKAIVGLQNYIAQVEQVFAAGHLRPETAQLLTDQANTLIQRIQAL